MFKTVVSEDKLFCLGFNKAKNNTFYYEKNVWCSIQRRMRPKRTAMIRLDKRGKILEHKGLPLDRNGQPILYMNLDKAKRF